VRTRPEFCCGCRGLDVRYECYGLGGCCVWGVGYVVRVA